MSNFLRKFKDVIAVVTDLKINYFIIFLGNYSCTLNGFNFEESSVLNVIGSEYINTYF